jgi:hypothetical protein
VLLACRAAEDSDPYDWINGVWAFVFKTFLSCSNLQENTSVLRAQSTSRWTTQKKLDTCSEFRTRSSLSIESSSPAATPPQRLSVGLFYDLLIDLFLTPISFLSFAFLFSSDRL